MLVLVIRILTKYHVIVLFDYKHPVNYLSKPNQNIDSNFLLDTEIILYVYNNNSFSNTL